MKEFNKEEYNKMCAEFLEFTEHIPNEERRKWNDECYPDLPYYRLEYNVPIQFGHDYITPTVLHVLYNDADKIPRLTEKIAVAKMKFHSDWNWIMEVVEKIETLIDGFVLFRIEDEGCFVAAMGVQNYNNYTTMATKKEAVIQAIWDFLNWHKENKS
jgi:hypothetical protein